MSSLNMSDYEQRAYARLTLAPRDSFSLMPRWARDQVSRASKKIQTVSARLPGKEVIEVAYTKAAKALLDFTTGHGLHSVSLGGSIRRLQKKGHQVEFAKDFFTLDLQQCDELLPNRKTLHQFSAIAEGAATSLAITGLEVSTTVSGGVTAAGVVGALAIDSVVVMAGLGRVIGEIAVTYGYDPNLPEEEIFAVQVLGVGMAVDSSAKVAGLASISRLTQDMMRRASWTQLNEHILVDVISRAFTALGLRLTQKKLAQVVPFVGIAISSGLNLVLLNRVHDAAMQAYRLRFLTEKYNLAPATSTALVLRAKTKDDAEEPVIRLDDLLLEAVKEAEVEENFSDLSPKNEAETSGN